LQGATAGAELREAFRELHGARLYGFALLVTLGDRARAARLATEALAASASKTVELRHPERAAAWLRRRVLLRARRLPGSGAGRPPSADGRLALQELGVDPAAALGLAALSIRERAVLAADSIERLDRRDAATIAGADGVRLDKLIRRARERYLMAAAGFIDEPSADAPTVARVRAVAERALS
jgi:hypothetical protein